MIATFDGQDYKLMLDRGTQDLHELRRNKLEAKLQKHFGNENLGKLVSLELADNNGCDGIELKYLPENPESWEAIQTVQVKMNERAYQHLIQRGKFGTRYNGSDKVEIVTENLHY